MANIYNGIQLAEIFKNLIQGDVSIAETDIALCAKDWSLFTIRPKIVVYPKCTEDIQRIVRWVYEHKHEDPTLSVTARSAGTDMTGGPLNDSIIVDVSRYMNHFLSLKKQNAHAALAVAEPGMYYRDFEKETIKKGFIMPCYPASREIACIGGMVANNGAGEKTLKYGQNKDFVVALQVVLDTGELCEVRPVSYKELQEKILLTTREGDLYRDTWSMVEHNHQVITKAKPKTTKNASGYLLWELLQSPSLAKFKNGSGFFDLTKLFVGAQGTTGIITQITYRLVSTKPMLHSRLVVSFINDITQLPHVVNTVLPYSPETFEVYDDNTFKIGVQFFGDFLKHKGIIGAIQFGLSFIPELWMVVRYGVPKLILMAEFAGEDETVVATTCVAVSADLRNLKVRNRITHSAIDAEKYWEFRHDSFKILTEHSAKARNSIHLVSGDHSVHKRTAPFIDDIIVDPKYFPEFLPKLQALLAPYHLLYTIAGHIGDGNLHIIPLMNMADESSKRVVIELTPKVYALVREFNGSISAEHNDGIIRTPFLALQYSNEVLELFKKVKQVFDPLQVFNPHKKVGATLDYLKKYLV